MAVAPTLQTTYTGNAINSGSTTTVSTTITVGAGSNQLLVVTATTANGSTIGTPTFNGSSTGMTPAAIFANNTQALLTSVWYLANPTQTTASLSVAGSFSTGIAGFLFSDVDLTNPIGGTNTTNGPNATTQSTMVTTNLDNSTIVSSICTGNNLTTTATGTNQTLGTQLQANFAAYILANSTQTTTAAGSYTQTFSYSSNTPARIMASVEIHGLPTTYTLTATTRSYSLTGNAVTFVKNHGYNLLVSTGLFTLTGSLTAFNFTSKWNKLVKHVSTWTKGTKHTSTWTKGTKN